MAPLDDDRALVASCLEASPAAWEAFVGRFAGIFFHVVRSTCSQQHRIVSAMECEDLVSEILLEILRNDAAVLRSYAGRSALAAYLTVVARRVVVRRLYRSRPVIRGTVHPEIDTVPAAVADARDAADRKEEVAGMISKLDDSEALLVRLHHIEARSYGEISRLTGLPLGSIGPALSKAREKMRRAGA